MKAPSLETLFRINGAGIVLVCAFYVYTDKAAHQPFEPWILPVVLATVAFMAFIEIIDWMSRRKSPPKETP